MAIFLYSLILHSAITSNIFAQYHDGFDHMADFAPADPANTTRIYWQPGEKDDDYIRFEIQTTFNKGWIGMGLAPSSAMRGADIVVMWFDKDGNAQINDRHGPATQPVGYPEIDDKQNYELLSADHNSSLWIFQFRRKMSTCDLNDWKVTRDTVHLLFAYSDTIPSSPQALQQHDGHFSKSIRLMGPDDRDRVQAVFHTPGVFPVDFPSGGVHLPNNADTLYNCRIFKLRKFEQPLHIVGYEMLIQPGNEKFVHHVLLYACHGEKMSELVNISESCYDGPHRLMNNCTIAFGGWAVGGQPFAYPNDMGIQYFGEKYDYFSAEFHYDNSNMTQNVFDNSSFRIYVTPNLRPTEIGKFNLGSDSNAFTIVIPKQQQKFIHYAYCPAACSNKLPETVTMKIISGFLHSHLAGRAIRVRHLRNGTELEPIIEDNYYDFNYQSPLIFPEREFRMGDELIVECEYDTMDRNITTLGGLSTHHEMCLVLFEYYPKNMFLEQRCMSVINRQGLPKVLGAKSVYPPLMGDPAETTVIDANGQNRSWTEWLENFNWTPDYINGLQCYVKNAPHISVCKLSKPGDPDSEDAFLTELNPQILHDYEPPDDNCSGMILPTGSSFNCPAPTLLPTATTTAKITATTDDSQGNYPSWMTMTILLFLFIFLKL